MQVFRNLDVWREAYRFGLDVYKLSRGLPREELYGLTSQLRRASMSIALNIAEGCGRSSDPDFRRCLHIAIGSAFETECLLMFAHDLKLLPSVQCSPTFERITVIRRKLNALIQRLK